jgi:two-component system NtrC family sensor kinase
MTSAGPVDTLSTRSYRDFRQLFDRVFASAGEGRITVDTLCELAGELRRFFSCRTVEIACDEQDRRLRALAAEGPRVSAWRERAAPAVPLLRSLHSLPPEALPPLEAERGRAPDRRRLAMLFPAPKDRRGTARASVRHAVMLIPGERSIAGAACLDFGEPRQPGDSSLDLLTRLASILGRSLSHNRSRFELRERVKELTCMYNLASLAASSEGSADRFLQSAAELLPPAYLYPEIARARIVCGTGDYRTAGWGDPVAVQSADLVIGDLKRGTVEVAYLEPRPELDEGPFLAEERRLLDSVAREIALTLERRQAEAEQARLQEQLRHADRLATIGKLAAGVAHELNEPLTGILGFAELLKDVPGMPAQAVGDLARIESAALHARDVVRKLLLFARQITPKAGRVAINRLVQDVLAFFEARLREHAIAVDTALSGDVPDFPGDESQIRQIIMNLVINAIHAMPAGGRLTLTTLCRGGEILLSVRDSGPGIPADIREKIFLPFFTTKDVDQGTGLGLSVAHGIVRAHRGRITVGGREGEGAEFTVVLPVRER